MACSPATDQVKLVSSRACLLPLVLADATQRFPTTTRLPAVRVEALAQETATTASMLPDVVQASQAQVRPVPATVVGVL